MVVIAFVFTLMYLIEFLRSANNSSFPLQSETLNVADVVGAELDIHPEVFPTGGQQLEPRVV